MRIRSIAFVFLIVILLTGSTFGKDPWITVKSKNFHLIGNAKEKDIRLAATKLEQFRQVFSHLFPSINLKNSVETNVIVFKNKKAYKPFLPKRGDGKPDEKIAGYFQPGEESNYITLSAGGNRADTFETIFHEYVHFLLNNNFERSQIPPWLNEGLAEYYSTFEIEDDQKVFLGNLRNDHLAYLSRSKFIPLEQFFAIDNYSLHRNGNHSRSVFYAQAWALVHFFAIKNEANKLSQFIELSKSENDPEKAFRAAFGYDYAAMEKILRKYVKQRKFTRLVASFKNKLVFDEGMSAEPLRDAEAFSYLGDLLFRMNELPDAETYLKQSLALEPNHTRSNTSLGLVKMRQKNFAEAKTYLEKAVAAESNSYYAHYSYAYLLSRGDPDGSGFVMSFKEGVADSIREAIKKAIEINPKFVPSYNLYAFVNLVTNEDLEEAEKYLAKSLEITPGSESTMLTLAQIYVRQNKFEKAQTIANDIKKSAVDGRERQIADQILDMVERRKQFAQKNDALRERYLGRSGGSGSELTYAEKETIAREREISQLNEMVAKLGKGHLQEIGLINDVVCDGNNISYSFTSADGKSISLKSDGFMDLELIGLAEMPENEGLSCEYKLKDIKVVVNYTPSAGSGEKGILRAVTWVPPYFRIKSAEEIRKDLNRDQNGGPGGDQPAPKSAQEAMSDAMRQILRKPGADEAQAVGIISKIECKKGSFGVILKTDNGSSLRLRTKTPQNMRMITFRRDVDASVMQCGGSPPNARVIVTYKSKPDTSDSDGKMVTLEFVPDGFTIK